MGKKPSPLVPLERKKKGDEDRGVCQEEKGGAVQARDKGGGSKWRGG
jgi:hypothetical protein